MSPIRFFLSLALLATSLSSALARATVRSTPDSDIQAYLSAHNNMRAKHGAKALTWSEPLASKAQQWADGCVFKHSGGSLGPYGGRLKDASVLNSP